MRSPTIVPLLALLAIVASGCGSDTPEATGEDPTASAPASAPANAPSAADATDAEAQPFDSPTVAEQATTTPATGLIGSTNSKERAIQVQRNIQANQKKTGGSNPFGILPVKTTSDLPEGSLTVAMVVRPPKPVAHLYRRSIPRVANQPQICHFPRSPSCLPFLTSHPSKFHPKDEPLKAHPLRPLQRLPDQHLQRPPLPRAVTLPPQLPPQLPTLNPHRRQPFSQNRSRYLASCKWDAKCKS